MSERGRQKPATAVTVLGRDPKQHIGAVNTPVYRATTILFDTVAELEAAVQGKHRGVAYGLHGLPTVTDVQAAFAALEGGYAGLAVPSGLAAITLALLAMTRAGDHVLVTDSVYGPTRRFCENQLRGLGVPLQTSPSGTSCGAPDWAVMIAPAPMVTWSASPTCPASTARLPILHEPDTPTCATRMTSSPTSQL